MSILARMLSLLSAAFALTALAAGAQAAVPQPEGLAPEVAFWERVFSECSSEQGLIHDNRHLDIVYEKLDATGEGGPERLQQLAKAAREKYGRILRLLATGQRNGLDAEARRVLALWPAGVSNAELAAAAGRVRFQQGLAERFHGGLLRSGQWREHIRSSLREAGVPEEVVALPHVESSFNPGARSYAGAVGLWQFTAGTGKRYLRIDQAVDERRDPFKSSEAAAQLLRHNFDRLGTWPLAITAYNHGAGGMRRAVNTMNTTDIETIVRRYDGPAFRFASRNFYVSFLAALAIDQEPEKYFGPLSPEAPLELVVLDMPDYMAVSTLEQTLGVPRTTLQAHNPALLAPVWTGTRYVPRGFHLRVPAGEVIKAPPRQLLGTIPPGQRFDRQLSDQRYRVKRGDTLGGIAARHGTSVTELARLNGLQSSGRILVGQWLKLPVSTATGSVSPAAAGGTYRVVRGDTLGGIAARHGTSVAALARLNGLSPDARILVGQQLKLSGDPGGSAAVAGSYRVVRGDTLGHIATRHGVSVAELARMNGLKPSAGIRIGQLLKVPGQQMRVHRVRSGDTLGGIAARYGVSLSHLATANGLRPDSLIRVGQSLRIPAADDRQVDRGPRSRSFLSPRLQQTTDGAAAASLAALNDPLFGLFHVRGMNG